jgi:hypothetical protein
MKLKKPLKKFFSQQYPAILWQYKKKFMLQINKIENIFLIKTFNPTFQ